jgi:uncharacterized repeat protein (TIGR01451 family)
MKKYVALLMLIFFVLAATEIQAAPLIAISMKAEKEVVVDNVKKKVPAENINPGETVFYTIDYVNSGSTGAQNAFIDDPIPRGTVYVPGTAFGKDAEITFSIDGGKTFKKPSLLTHEVRLPNGKVEKRSAMPERYTHVRWTINDIPAGGKGQVGFQVKMK